MSEEQPHQPTSTIQAHHSRDYKDDPDQNHPDAPLPQPQSYRDDPDAYPETETDLESLTRYEPIPISSDENENENDDEYNEEYANAIDATAESSRPRTKYAAKARIFWLRNKGMFLVLLAQMFGASMNVMTQVLEIHSSMHPFQILFARMSITALASYIYMFITSTPHPLGTKPVLHLLLLRAVSGFTGVYGLYYSVQYLPLSEATVITFLAPIMTCYACSFFIPGETFSRRQQLAALVSLIGVVLIARPFRSRGSPSPSPDESGTPAESPDEADAYHHVLATIVASIGVLGAAGAYTSIRMIGRRAHPLVSVTYFSSVTTIISLLAMLAVPSVEFRIPNTRTEWLFMIGLGVCGFLLQFLLTAGLSYVPPKWVQNKSVSGAGKGQGSKATSMVYTQMLFALFYDKVVWGTTLDGVAWAGSALILACAVYVAVMQEGTKTTQQTQQSTEQSSEDQSK